MAMTPEIERAIEEFLRERLEIRIEADRYGDFDGRVLEVTARLVLVESEGEGFGSSYTETEISKASGKVHLEYYR